MVNREVDALLLLAEALIHQTRFDEATSALNQADELLVDSPDAEQTLRLGLLRSTVSSPELALERLAWVEQTAGQQGFQLLMKRARKLIAQVE